MAENSARATVIAIIAAGEAGDIHKFDQAFQSVDDDTVALLEKFLIETATGKYEVFSVKDSPLLAGNPLYARAMLRAWRRVGSARGRMSARMAFENILSISRRIK